MHSFETDFMIWLGSLSGKSMIVDATMILLLNNDFLKGVPFALGILLTWEVPLERGTQSHRVFAMRMLIVVFLSVLAARLGQHFFASPRPIMIKEIADHYSNLAKSARVDWNSFPSDHLALYFPIGLMVALRFRKLGIALITWSIIGVAIPRLFYGRHFPSDILGGMMLGSAMFGLVWKWKDRIDPSLVKIANKAEQFPVVSLSLLFLLCFQIATVFDGARQIGYTLKEIIKYYG